MKAFQDFIEHHAAKLTAAVCVKDLNVEQASFYRNKGFMNWLGILVRARGFVSATGWSFCAIAEASQEKVPKLTNA